MGNTCPKLFAECLASVPDGMPAEELARLESTFECPASGPNVVPRQLAGHDLPLVKFTGKEVCCGDCELRLVGNAGAGS